MFSLFFVRFPARMNKLGVAFLLIFVVASLLIGNRWVVVTELRITNFHLMVTFPMTSSTGP